jgi:uncharacterized SAM-binding protein YcdF (DUF218 family)
MMAPVFLTLSKILDLFLGPLTWALVLGAVGLWQTRRHPGLARALLALGLFLLVTFSLAPVSHQLYAALERRATDTFRPAPPYDVVIVLGGVGSDAAWRPGEAFELGPAGERIVRASALLRAGQARSVLLSGGNASPFPGEPAESEQLALLLRKEGIPPERIVTEPRSRNTRENALESAAVVAAHPEWKRILLLTSAWHAPRALGCFRAVGLDPDLLTVDHRGRAPLEGSWAPRAKALSDSTDALRELAGGGVYRAVGYAR